MTEDTERTVVTIPIEIGGVTMLGCYIKRYPSPHGNCFSLRDTDDKEHKVVNFNYENLKEWMKRTGQKDIRVRCIPKSDHIWEIADERIPSDWYSKEYCPVCTPLRMLPLEQRKKEMARSTYKKVKLEDGGELVLRSTLVKSSAKKLMADWKLEVTDTPAECSPGAEELLKKALSACPNSIKCTSIQPGNPPPELMADQGPGVVYVPYTPIFKNKP